MFPRLSLVLGGARSGKSAFAERLVLASGLDPVYVATAETRQDDAEMLARIAAHRGARSAAWRTIEAPRDLAAVLDAASAGAAILIDCATLWLGNRMLAGDDIAQAQEGLIAALERTAAPVVIVSNEVGSGIVPDNRLARQFRDAQGLLNQTIAGRADLALLVVSGLPLLLKGRLPDGIS